MDGQRHPSPQRMNDSSLNQINSLQQPSSNNPNNYPLRHRAPSQHMQVNGPLSRPLNMTVGGPQPQPSLSIQGQNALQPGTVYLIRSPSGDLQLVRLAPNQPNGGGNGQRPSLLNQQLGNGIRFPPPNNLVSQPPPGSQQLNQAQLSALSSQGHSGAPPGMGAHPMHVQQNTPQHMMNHGVNQGNMQHLMRPPMQGPPSGPPPLTPNQQAHKIEDPLNKAKQFFTALLTMSRNQTPTMFPTAQDLLQQLVDARINPDMFAQRLQEELKSTPQPILAPLLKVCLAQLRQGLASGHIVIEGISPPPAAALLISDPSATISSINTGASAPPPSTPMTNKLPPEPLRSKHEASTVPSRTGGKSGKNAAKNTGTMNASAPNNSEQHPVFSSLPQLQAHHPKVEKVKQMKVATEKKPTAKQKKQQQMHEQKSKADQDMFSIHSTGPLSKEQKEHKIDEDELTDVVPMCGINLSEESARLSSADIVGTQTRSIGDQSLLPMDPVRRRVSAAVRGYVYEDVPADTLTIISHAIEARIRNCCERLNVIAEHRSESVRGHSRYRPTQDIREQMKFMETLDRVEKRKREEEEKETLQKAAKSRNRPEDPEHTKLKKMAKEAQLREQEELRRKEADQAAFAALGGAKNKKPRLDAGPEGSSAGPSVMGVGRTEIKSQPYRPRIKRANLRDVVFMAETDGKMSKSPLLYQILHQIK